MPIIAGTATRLPPHRYSQETLTSTLRRFCTTMGYDIESELIDSLFKNALIQQRYFALPLDDFFDPPPRAVVNDLAFAAAIDICTGTIEDALENGGVGVAEVTRITSMMTTLFAVPTVETQIMTRLGLSPMTKRVPLNGLGCMAGIAGLARTNDYLKGHPREAAVLISCEFGGTAFWLGGLQGFLKYATDNIVEQPSLGKDIVAQLVSAALFGDGVAAVVMVGDEHPRAKERRHEIVGTRGVTLPDTESIMNVKVLDHGFMNDLSPDVPKFAAKALRMAIDSLCAEHGIAPSEIRHWGLHPGGPKVIDAIAAEFGLSTEAAALTWRTLASIGNVSAPTVLYMLDELRRQIRPKPGEYGLLASMGPGFSVETALVRW